jgi:hypothetical protein
MTMMLMIYVQPQLWRPSGCLVAVFWSASGCPRAAGSHKGTKKQPKTSQMAETRTAMTAAAATIVAMSKLN